MFRYLREYALKIQEYCNMVCIDDKHKLKVGEPGFPVAAAERGRQVLVRAGTTFEVADHDFTKFSITPSVCLVVDIPDSFSDPWYRGQVLVGYKDTSFEPSSPLRHATELSYILNMPQYAQKSILFLYCDGGPDHRLTYISVQLSLIALFLQLDLDFLCVARTAPSHSWRNAVERVMSTLNLGLQCIGLMRDKMDERFEEEAAKCNSLATLREAAKRSPGFQDAALDSIAHLKCLLTSLTERLELKGKKFTTFSAANEADMQLMKQTLRSCGNRYYKSTHHSTKKKRLPKETLNQDELQEIYGIL